MERWVGRTALVTGASSGIGREIAVKLLNHGVNVVVCARRVELLSSIVKEVKPVSGRPGKLLPVQCDVAKEEDILALFAKVKASEFLGIDICVNNAGVATMTPLSEGKTKDWSTMFQVNVIGLSVCTREALKSMKERGIDDGHVIHISSNLSRNVAPGAVMYSASKHAVKALTEGLRMELAAQKSSIRVTEICPGLVKTEMPNAALGDELASSLYEAGCLTPEDIANGVLHALSAPKHVQVHDMLVLPIGKPSG